ncbi:MAG: pilin [bacterium]
MNKHRKSLLFILFIIPVFSFLLVKIETKKTLAFSGSQIILAQQTTQYDQGVWNLPQSYVSQTTTGFQGYGAFPNYTTYQSDSVMSGATNNTSAVSTYNNGYQTTLTPSNRTTSGGTSAGFGGTNTGLQDYWNTSNPNSPYSSTPAPTPTKTLTSTPIITPQQSSQTGPNESGICGINVVSDTWNYCMLTPVGGLIGSEKTDSMGKTESVSINDGLQPFFAKIYKIGIGVAIALAVVMISFGGIRLATTDSISGTENGRKMINAAFAGLFLALFSYVLLYTINPALLNNGDGNFFNTATKEPGVDSNSTGGGGDF